MWFALRPLVLPPIPPPRLTIGDAVSPFEITLLATFSQGVKHLNQDKPAFSKARFPIDLVAVVFAGQLGIVSDNVTIGMTTQYHGN